MKSVAVWPTPTSAPRIFESNPLHSHSSKLFVAPKKLNPFGIKQIQTLSPKHPGWGTPQPLRTSAADQFARPLFSWSYKLLFPEPVCFENICVAPGVGVCHHKIAPAA